MATDTDFDKTDDGQRGRYFKFDPTVSSGTIIQAAMMLFGIAGAYFALDKGQAVQQARIDQVEINATAESQRVKESLTEIKGDLKEVQRTVNEINTSLAGLKAVR